MKHWNKFLAFVKKAIAFILPISKKVTFWYLKTVKLNLEEVQILKEILEKKEISL